MRSRVGLFGKLPSAADFVQRGPHGDTIEAFRDWLEQGVERAAVRKTDPLRTALGDARIFGFVFRETDAELVVGALKPSLDAALRCFPLSVYVLVDTGAARAQPHLLPLALGEIVQEAAETLLADDVIAAAGRLDQALGAAVPLAPSSLSEHASAYASWAASTTVSAAFEAVFSEAPGPPSSALHTIRETIAPFYGREDPPTPLSVRVPLGRGGAGALAFWLDLVRSSAGWQRTIPSVFWSNEELGGEALIQLGDTPSATLAELWAPDPNSDYVCDVTHAIDVDGFLEPLSPRVLAVLDRSDATVSELMNVLKHGPDDRRLTT